MTRILAFAAAAAISTSLALATPVAARTPQPAHLVDTAWTVVQINDQQPKSTRAEIRFKPGRVSATAGCNGLGGTWQIRQGRLHGGPFLSTMMYCEGLMEDERAMADVLGGKPRIDVTGGILTLRLGKQVILARRQPNRV